MEGVVERLEQQRGEQAHEQTQGDQPKVRPSEARSSSTSARSMTVALPCLMALPSLDCSSCAMFRTCGGPG